MSAWADDEVIDIDELSQAILTVGRRQTREINRLKRQIEQLKRDATAWIIRAGVAEGMTQTQIQEAINDMKGE